MMKRILLAAGLASFGLAPPGLAAAAAAGAMPALFPLPSSDGQDAGQQAGQASYQVAEIPPPPTSGRHHTTHRTRRTAQK